MLILNYLEPKNGISNPREPLSLHLHSQAITLDNSKLKK